MSQDCQLLDAVSNVLQVSMLPGLQDVYFRKEQMPSGPTQAPLSILLVFGDDCPKEVLLVSMLSFVRLLGDCDLLPEGAERMRVHAKRQTDVVSVLETEGWISINE